MKRRAIVTILVLLLALALGAPAHGQAPEGEGDGTPPVPTNEYGTPDMNQIDLTHEYTYTEQVTVGETVLGPVTVELRYEVYSDNHGNTWVVPTPQTLATTALYPDLAPGALSSRADGWAYGSSLTEWFDDIGGFEALGIDVQDIDWPDEPGAFFRAVWEAHAGEGGHFEFLLKMWQMLADQGTVPLWQMSLIYPDDPFDPTDDATPTPDATSTPFPTGLPTPTPRPTATPMPTPITCPPESISQQPPVMILIESHPPNPVVVGQGGQGLDVSVRAISYPVIHRWWTPEREYECRWWDTDTYGVPSGHRGHCCPEGNSDCDRDHYYRVPEGPWYCQEHVRRIPDPILMEYLRGTADLHKTSIEWIETDLAGKYPGARVRHPHWGVDGVGQPYFTLDWRCIVEALVHFPFEDPGYYDIQVHGQTAGTIYTPPRSFSYVMEEPQAVYLMDTMLIR
jgi:hypothetical protein